LPFGATVIRGSEDPDEPSSCTVLKTGLPLEAVAGSAVLARPVAATAIKENKTRRVLTAHTVRWGSRTCQQT
jgi:hypothetical protein